MRELKLGHQIVNDKSDCYVIAEIGHNHKGDMKTCMELFQAAKESGAHAVKLQKRNNRQLFTREGYERPYDNPNSYGATYGEHREFLEFERAEYLELQKYAQELDIDFFSTAFDHSSADFLNELNMPAFKMASGDLKSIPLLKHVASFGKPMIISTGGGTMEDVKRAYDAIMPLNQQLVILQCTAGYPPEYEELNLKVIETFRNEFPETIIGLSSHDNGIAMSLCAYMLGARVVEKHFTLNRAWKGTDHSFSLEPTGMRKMIRDLKRARVAMGDGIKKTYDSEVSPLIKMGKKCVAARDIEKGHVLNQEDITFKSPGDGMPPYELDYLIGKVTRAPLKEDAPFSPEVLEL